MFKWEDLTINIYNLLIAGQEQSCTELDVYTYVQQ